jgi:tetratricopeptide (TPR) repeat protein
MDYAELSTAELVRQSEELERSGDKTQALELLRHAIEREPTLLLFCRYGLLAEDQGEFMVAEEAYLSANHLAPEMPDPYGLLGLLYLKRYAHGDLERAHKYFKRLVELQKRPGDYCILGVIQNRLGLTIKARESFNEALQLNPNNDEALYNLGVTYRQEDPEKAITLFRKALEIDPDYQLAHRELGWALNRLEQYIEGEMHLRRAIELDDNDGWAYIYWAQLLWRKNEVSLAEEAYKKAIEIWPDDSLPHWCIAHFYEYQERTAEADFFYEKASQLDPEDPETNLRFGIFLKDIGETKKAKDHLNRALVSDPNDNRVKLALAELEELDETESTQKAN